MALSEEQKQFFETLITSARGETDLKLALMEARRKRDGEVVALVVVSRQHPETRTWFQFPLAEILSDGAVYEYEPPTEGGGFDSDAEVVEDPFDSGH